MNRLPYEVGLIRNVEVKMSTFENKSCFSVECVLPKSIKINRHKTVRQDSYIAIEPKSPFILQVNDKRNTPLVLHIKDEMAHISIKALP